jgi:hypothetical protein
MEGQLTFKIELEYLFENKKVIFHNEICNDGLSTKSISVGNNKVIEKTIKDRVLSGECLIDGITCGYAYVYDQNGTTIALNPTNKNISLNESIDRINKVKKSKEFLKAEINGLMAITNCPEFISSPCKKFTVYKEMKLTDGQDTFVYLLKINFSCDEKKSEIESKEEKYQINDNYVSFFTDLKTNVKRVRYNIDNNELETTQQDDITSQEGIQSIITQLQPLKELLNTSPKNHKSLIIATKKTIR